MRDRDRTDYVTHGYRLSLMRGWAVVYYKMPGSAYPPNYCNWFVPGTSTPEMWDVAQ